MVAGTVLLFAFACQQSPSQSQQLCREALWLYGQALILQRDDRLVTATTRLEEAVRLDPDALPPRIMLVPLYSALGRINDAQRGAAVVLAIEPGHASTALWLAQLQREQGRLDDAIATLSHCAAQRPAEIIAVLHDLGTIHERRNDRNAAAAAYRQALDAKPSDRERAELFLALGRTTRDRAVFEQARTTFRTLKDEAAAVRVDIHIASMQTDAGEFKDANQALDAFLAMNPRDAAACELKAQLARQSNDPAIFAGLERLAREQSDFSPLIVSLADEYHRRGDWPKAEAAYLSVVSREANVSAYRRLLSAYASQVPQESTLPLIDAQFRVERPSSQNEHARAILQAFRSEPLATMSIAVQAERELNRRAIPWQSQTWRLIGSAALAINRFDCAQGLFRHALEAAGPDADFEIYDGLFRALQARRNWKEIVSECRRASVQSRSIPPEYFARHQAKALMHLDRIDEALAVLDRAMPDARRSAILSLRLCRVSVLTYAERFAEVESEATELLDQHRNPTEIRRIRRTLSYALRLADDPTKAESHLRQVIAKFPDDGPSLHDLGSLLVEENRNLPEAERLIRRALELDRREKKDSLDQEGDPAAYLDSLAWLLFRRGQYSTAREMLERASKTGDGQRDPSVWDHLGDVCEQLGDRSAAIAAWNEARHWSAAIKRTRHDGRAAEIARKIQLRNQTTP